MLFGNVFEPYLWSLLLNADFFTTLERSPTFNCSIL